MPTLSRKGGPGILAMPGRTFAAPRPNVKGDRPHAQAIRSRTFAAVGPVAPMTMSIAADAVSAGGAVSRGVSLVRTGGAVIGATVSRTVALARAGTLAMGG